MDYIEREAIVNNSMLHTWKKADLLKAIKDAPSADVAPVRRAKWEVVIGSDGKEHMVCTGCRKQQELTGVFTYCPNCGAKMDLEDTNHGK